MHIDKHIILINVHELLKEYLKGCLTLTLVNDLDAKYFKNTNPSIDHDQYCMYRCYGYLYVLILSKKIVNYQNQ